jgi:hypothetical protein
LQEQLLRVTMFPAALHIPSTQTGCCSPAQMISHPGLLSFAQTSAERLQVPDAYAGDG